MDMAALRLIDFPAQYFQLLVSLRLAWRYGSGLAVMSDFLAANTDTKEHMGT
jgi:hypothetical protein